MAIPTGTVFSSIPAAISEKKSSLNNARHEGYTIGDVADAVSDVQLNDVGYKAATIAYVEANIIPKHPLLKVGTISQDTTSGVTTNIFAQDVDVFLVDISGGAGNVDINISLPASTSQGRIISFICDSTCTATETLTLSAADNINGASSLVLNTPYSVVRVISTGSEWLRID